MTLAEKIFAEVRALPEPQAREVLDFVGHLKTKQRADRSAAIHAAMVGLARYRGRFKAARFSNPAPSSAARPSMRPSRY